MSPGLAWRLGDADLYFVNAQDGYEFEPDCPAQCVRSTRDGGRTWTTTPIPATAQLIAADSQVVALTHARGVWTVETSEVGSTTWTTHQVPFPHAEGLRIAAAKGSIALLSGGRVVNGGAIGPSGLGAIWTSTDGAQSWVGVRNPCRARDGAAAGLAVDIRFVRTMWVDCYDGQQSSQETATKNHLFVTENGGATWTRTTDPATVGAPDLIVSNGAEHVFVATDSGVVDVLHGSTDAGARWTSDIINEDGGFGWGDLRFLDQDDAFVLTRVGAPPPTLHRTRDAGRSWTKVDLPR